MTSKNQVRLARDVELDVDRLIHMLVTASTGAGKSMAIRTLLERSHGKIQQLVVDWEGEFATLREAGDYVLVGKDGDLPADVRSARLLVRRMLEFRFNVVFDLSELQVQKRHEYVRAVCATLADEVPRELWHDLLVIVDEAHKFAPEQEKRGESSVAKPALVELATRGRKRGFKLVLATQRLAKLDKDITAECHDRLVGQQNDANDRDRALKELGVKGRMGDEVLLKLEPGHFLAAGPAMGIQNVREVHLDMPETRPPPKGAGARAPPPAKRRVTEILKQLADLPQQADQEARTVAELQVEVRRLKRDLQAAGSKPRVETKVVEKRVETPVLTPRELARLEAVANRLGLASKVVAQLRDEVERAVGVVAGDEKVHEAAKPRLVLPPAPRVRVDARPDVVVARASSNGDVPKGEKSILIAVAEREEGATREQLTVFTGYKRSTRDAYVLRLMQRGLVKVDGYTIKATEEGRVALGSDYEPLPTGDALRQHWMDKLPGGERRCFAFIVIHYPESVSREDVSEETGFKRSTRDAYLQRLRTRGVITAMGDGTVRASDHLFDNVMAA